MVDKFPEAFKRFERTVKTEDLTFKELLKEFGVWQKRGVSRLQEQCLKSEYEGTPLSFFKQEIKFKFGNRTVFRDRKTGKFTDRYGKMKYKRV